MVVDRFKVRDDLPNVLPSRLKPRWSFPVVPRSGGYGRPESGRAAVLRQLCLPICGYSMRELEPRLFSFNNRREPARPVTVLAYSNISILTRDPESGIVAGWRCDPWLGSPNFYYFQMLKSLADHYKFDVERRGAA